jgi:hypothetical protein
MAAKLPERPAEPRNADLGRNFWHDPNFPREEERSRSEYPRTMREDQTPELNRPQQDEHQLTRTLMWIGVAGLGAVLAFTVARALLARRVADPTTQRIQQLIDEANHLLKTLDDQRNSA